MSVYELIYALVLGAVQGISEFLPISSSAHLIATSWLFNGETLPLTLNIGLHLGTVFAVLIYFRRDFIRILQALLDRGRSAEYRFEWRVLLPGLILGTVPAGVIGILFKDDIERVFHHPYAIIGPLAVVGVLLWAVDARRPQDRELRSLTIKDALIIGIFQACALIPGTSRSGATIIGGRMLGLARTDAARFSFLLGTPAMLGAAILESKGILGSVGDPVFYVGCVTAAVTGLIAIHFLLQFVRRFGFLAFAIYRIIVALTLFLLLSS